MQETQDGGGERAEHEDRSGDGRLLESPGRITILYKGTPVLSVHDATKSVSTGEVSAIIVSGSVGYWSHIAALLVLQGASIQQVLGPEWVMCGGSARPACSVRPGIDDICIGLVTERPHGMTPRKALVCTLLEYLAGRY